MHCVEQPGLEGDRPHLAESHRAAQDITVHLWWGFEGGRPQSGEDFQLFNLNNFDFCCFCQVSCTISSGDMPIEIEWKKDGETFDPPTDIQVNPLRASLYCITGRQHCVTGITAVGIALSYPTFSYLSYPTFSYLSYPQTSSNPPRQVQNNVFSSNILFFSLRASHSGWITHRKYFNSRTFQKLNI